MARHEQAREVLRDAFARRGISPSRAELQLVQSIGWLESGENYGAGLGNNWGSIHAPGPPCGAGSRPAVDTDSKGRKYDTCLRVYADPVSGAADLVRELYRRRDVARALRTGNALAVAKAMRTPSKSRTGTIIGSYHETRPDRYARGLQLRSEHLANILDEPLAVSYARNTTGNQRVVTGFVVMALGGAGIWFGMHRWRALRGEGAQ